MVFGYTAYELGVRASFPLPELLPLRNERVNDVLVRLCPMADGHGETVADVSEMRSADEAAIRWRGIGLFEVRRGCEIDIVPAPAFSEGLLRAYLLGPAFALLLRQRGFLVLHASAVAVGQEAWIFLGASRWGKSTFAAALCRHGARLLSDDVTAVTLHGGRPMASPGYPQIKLWPDSAEALGWTPGSLSPLHDQTEKLACRTGFEFCRSPLPVGRVFVLSDAPYSQMVDLEPQAALIELVRHSALVRDLPPDHAPAHLRDCVALVNAVHVTRLALPRDFAALPNIVPVLVNEYRLAKV
jgi:hypothetical protein